MDSLIRVGASAWLAQSPLPVPVRKRRTTNAIEHGFVEVRHSPPRHDVLCCGPHHPLHLPQVQPRMKARILSYLQAAERHLINGAGDQDSHYR
jgi:hypothetical protein